MKLSIKYITIIFLAGGLLFNSCKKSDEKSTLLKVKKTPLVKVETVKKLKMTSFINITGTVQANIFSDVKSTADGTIEKLYARENQWVEKNRIIAIINPNDRVALISNNQSQTSQLERKLKSADKNSAEYQVLLQEFENAKKNLVYAKNMYQTIPVICPMSGLVTKRWLDNGSQVSAKENILTISDMNSLVIKAEVNEKYFEAIKQGKKLQVMMNAYPNDTLTATISLVYPQVDPVTRSVKFDVKILNFKKSLLPGMMASIKIPVSMKENALSVSEQAILTSPDNKFFLFVIDKDSIAFRKVIEKGISSGNKLEILKGLNENDKVVVSGQEMLKDSMKVKIMGTHKTNKK
ncbi:efflux RND transporter periplasmic adaptor subunit [Yeosuana marina]|uniref:efflux RND transporter periplasmic adaptor subunit n=1 Tax=Yeosuana marina TaxID=1565536 RepID=UPI001421578A|nr:efflux RND transporter periplasmic adaptor subunit [Yeosuana marina]